jgi:hypothetical protein
MITVRALVFFVFSGIILFPFAIFFKANRVNSYSCDKHVDYRD